MDVGKTDAQRETLAMQLPDKQGSQFVAMSQSDADGSTATCAETHKSGSPAWHRRGGAEEPRAP